ncbi:alpha-hydroxy acid oxidase [Novosphingobium sp. BL-8A]
MGEEIWGHIQEGAGAELTLRQNTRAFERLGFLPRAFQDLRTGNTEATLFGHRHRAPFLLAPIAYQRLAHAEGELASVRAAAALGAGFIASTLSSVTIEEIAVAARDASQETGQSSMPLWFQLYLQPDPEDSLTLVKRAEDAGYQAIVLTIDAAVKLSGIALPSGVDAVNLKDMVRLRQTSVANGAILFNTPLADASPRWSDLAALRRATRLPILIKGMVLGEDARRAVDEGTDGLILSNHGGRVLDGLPSPLDLLAEVIAAAGSECPVLIDGGIRRGSDVVKAVAMGAAAVLLGRPYIHGLAVAGMVGVAHVIHMLRSEMEIAMAQLGCPTLADLTPQRLRPLP